MTENLSDYHDWVEHPKFGRYPRITGIELESVWATCWALPPEDRIPNTGIVAAVERQKVVDFPIPVYFDQKRVCEDCGRSFIWFAEEQKFWFEELGFYLGTNCVRCVHCRQRRKGRLGKSTPDSVISLEGANLLRLEKSAWSVDSDELP